MITATMEAIGGWLALFNALGVVVLMEGIIFYSLLRLLKVLFDKMDRNIKKKEDSSSKNK